jgi:hypothetical protein
MHSERLENVLTAVIIQRLPGHAPDQLAQDDEIKIAVYEPLVWRVRRGVRSDLL